MTSSETACKSNSATHKPPRELTAALLIRAERRRAASQAFFDQKRWEREQQRADMIPIGSIVPGILADILRRPEMDHWTASPDVSR